MIHLDCTGDSLEITFNNSFSTVLWSSGATSNSIFVKTPGIYWAEINDGACSNIDTIIVTDISSTYVDILDTTFCYGEKWTINLPFSDQYLWFNGSSNSNVIIVDSGLYWVQITNLCKTYIDSFIANVTDCNCLIVVPNVFTPNNDGLNDNFYPVINCELTAYQIYIFNRWSNLLFQSYNQYEVWNGKFHETNVPDGVYFYLINYSYKFPSVKDGIKTGSITVYR